MKGAWCKLRGVVHITLTLNLLTYIFYVGDKMAYYRKRPREDYDGTIGETRPVIHS